MLQLLRRASKGLDLPFFRIDVAKTMKFPQLFCFTDGRKVVDCHGSGSPMYLAPETIFEKPVGFAVDMWACGVILYLLLVSHAFSCPFNSHNTLGSLCTDALSPKKKKSGRGTLSPQFILRGGQHLYTGYSLSTRGFFSPAIRSIVWPTRLRPKTLAAVTF